MRCDEIGPREIPAVQVHRIALNMNQIRSMRPPENPAKLTDSRASGYVRRFGKSSWELDAIEPAKLARQVEAASPWIGRRPGVWLDGQRMDPKALPHAALMQARRLEVGPAR
jgi:hypothetical protein